MPAEDSCSCGWVKLYHPRGPLVTIPVTAQKADFGAMLANVSAAMDAGWLAWAPGLEQGETKLEIVAVVRMSKENRDRTESPMLALYEHGNAFKSLTVYLDTDEQVAAFLHASGLKSLTDIPLLDGTTAPERGKSKSADGKVFTLARPMGVIVQPNPKYDASRAAKATQADPYTVPKIVFVRWVEQRAAAIAAETMVQPTAVKDEPPTEEQVYATWETFLKADPSVADLNKRINDVFSKLDAGPFKARLWALVKEHARAAKLVWSDSARGYVIPQNRPS